MSRVYIAAMLPLLDEAKMLADGLCGEGLDVVSTWHNGAPTVAEEEAQGIEAQAETAERCLAEVNQADVLVLLYGVPTSRHGSFAEAFYALGLGKPVVAIPTAAYPLPTILLLGHRRVRRTALTLAALGSAAVAYHVRQALRGAL